MATSISTVVLAVPVFYALLVGAFLLGYLIKRK